MRVLPRSFVMVGVAGVVCTGLATNAPAATDFEGNVNEFFMEIDNWSSGLRNTNHNIGNFESDGEGVVFDPVNNPRETIEISDRDSSLDESSWDPSTNTYSGFNKVHLGDIQPGIRSKLTVKSGVLNPFDDFQVGRRQDTTGVVVQEGGTVRTGDDIRMTNEGDNSTAIYDYRGGTLDIGGRLRLGRSDGSNNSARLVVNNPDGGGKVAIGEGLIMGENPGSVGTAEFHYANGGTRTVQVNEELSLRNNDADPQSRSARLDLVLDEAVETDASGIPEDLALIATGDGIGGTGANAFYNADGTELLEQGDLVTAAFEDEEFAWEISYEGDITFSDAENSVVSGISPTGGNDVVLSGVPEPTTLGLVGLGLVGLVGRRQRR